MYAITAHACKYVGSAEQQPAAARRDGTECHNYVGHNYVGHNYVGHNHTGHNCVAASFELAEGP